MCFELPDWTSPYHLFEDMNTILLTGRKPQIKQTKKTTKKQQQKNKKQQQKKKKLKSGSFSPGSWGLE